MKEEAVRGREACGEGRGARARHRGRRVHRLASGRGAVARGALASASWTTSATGRRENLAQSRAQRVRRGDMRDAAACREACAGVGSSFTRGRSAPCRAREDPDDRSPSTSRDRQRLRRGAGRRRPRVVYASSSSVYGDSRAAEAGRGGGRRSRPTRCPRSRRGAGGELPPLLRAGARRPPLLQRLRSAAGSRGPTPR